MIECISYERVNDLYFNDSPEKAIEVFGEPELKSKSRSGNIELYYDISKKNTFDYKIIFDENNKFSEFMLYPFTKVKINKMDIKWTLEGILPIIEQDSDPRMDPYSITLYDLGILFGEFNPEYIKSNGSINIFRKGELDEFRKDTKPFNLNEYHLQPSTLQIND